MFAPTISLPHGAPGPTPDMPGERGLERGEILSRRLASDPGFEYYAYVPLSARPPRVRRAIHGT